MPATAAGQARPGPGTRLRRGATVGRLLAPLWSIERRAVIRSSPRRTDPTSVLRTVLLFAFAALAVTCVPAPAALATPDYVHGGIHPAACEVCHTDNHTNWPVASEKCLSCHTGYDAPGLPATCWTCHLPGQDMTSARGDAACTAACHLPNGSISLHTAHAGGGAGCTTCHPVSPTVSVAGGDPHHDLPAPAAPTVAGFSPSGGAPGTAVTVTGTGLARTIAVTFGDVPASSFRVRSDEELTAIVPVGAATGPVAVVNAGGMGTSPAAFVVSGRVTASVTLAVSPADVRRGGRVTAAGVVGPAALGRTAVTITVQRKAGARWTTATAHTLRSSADGGYGWAWRPPRSGLYRMRAALAATATHTAARSARQAFRVR